MIIHLVRHGDTQVGDDGLYLPNAGLTELGRRQALQAANRIAEVKPDAAFTSTLPRAIETAGIFTRITDQTAHQIPNLDELDTGNIWDAPHPTKVRISNGEYGIDYKALGGESMEDFATRTQIGFSQLLMAGTDLNVRSIAAFLHEGLIQSILDYLDGFDSYDNDRRGHMPNGALVTIDTDDSAPHYPGNWDTAHLDDPARH
jgi:broad specificity phosphatase PhoE